MEKTLALVSSWSLLALVPLSRVPEAGGCDPGPRQPPGREASVADTLPRCWPRAGPAWPPLSDQEEGIPSLASPSFGHGVSLLLSAPDSTPFVPLLTGWVPCSLVGSPAHWLVPLLTGWFPCSLVGSGSPCSLVSSPWSWASPLAPIRPPTWRMASSACPQLLLASHPRHGPYCMCQAWRSATHLTPNTPAPQF